jgi:hypothetical protein
MEYLAKLRILTKMKSPKKEATATTTVKGMEHRVMTTNQWLTL